LRRSQADLQRDLEEARAQLDRERAAWTAAADEASRVAATQREELEAALRWQGEAARVRDELEALARRHAELEQDLEKERDQSQARFSEAEQRWRAESDALSGKLERAVQQHDEAEQRAREAARQAQERLASAQSDRETLEQTLACARQEFSQEKERLA